MHRIPVGILGASGYAGRELCELVAGHPNLELRFAAANSRAGETVRVGGGELTFVAPDDVPLGEVGVVFSALPHGASALWVERAREAGARVVDLSTDLRPGSGAAGVPYGLPEARPALVAAGIRGEAPVSVAPLLMGREALAGATVVANPGCYPTAILLALQPLVAEGLLLPGATISIAAASGVTGAGMSPKPELLFGEVTENYRAYGVGNEHRHLVEMREVMAGWGADADLLFTPHLLPVARGILATITVPLVEPLAGDDPTALWRDFYAAEPFVEVTGGLPELRDVQRRNVVRVGVRRAAGLRTPTAIVVAAIDNLTKGAAGQAVQNANIILGLPETAGLPR
ncbi:MAG TPA: N-acetyl-gamma-glutamyl-phosphate reductase [Gemmatimonadales bacterium]